MTTDDMQNHIIDQFYPVTFMHKIIANQLWITIHKIIISQLPRGQTLVLHFSHDLDVILAMWPAGHSFTQ